jgi:hypothetical protein
MIYKERTFTRPNVDIPWHGEILTTPEHREYLAKNYTHTGKIIFKEKVVSDDGLRFTIKYLFDSMESLNEHAEDPVLLAYVEARKDYNNTMGITESDKIITSVE